MSNICPWYIKPEFFNTVEVRVESRDFKTSYFTPETLNVMTEMSRDPNTNEICMINIINGTNFKNQIIQLVSDPVYIDNIQDPTTGHILSIHYALMCLKGMDIEPFSKCNIFTTSRNTYYRLLYIFDFVRCNKQNQFKLNRFRRSLKDSLDQNMFDALLINNLELNLLFIVRRSNNASQVLHAFNKINRKSDLEANIIDIALLEGLAENVHQCCLVLNQNKQKEINYYKNYRFS